MSHGWPDQPKYTTRLPSRRDLLTRLRRQTRVIEWLTEDRLRITKLLAEHALELSGQEAAA